MDTFLFSLNATLPVFITIMIGYILKRFGFFDEKFTEAADRFTFRVTLPVLLFTDIATSNLGSSYDIKFMLFCMGVSCAAFFLIWGGAVLFLRNREQIGAFTMASFRGSAAVLGIALVTNIYGSTGLAPLMVVSVVPFYNAFSVIVLTIYAKRPEGEEKKIPFGKILFQVITNPLIIAVALALPFALFRIHIPTIPAKVLSNFATIATPFALVILGAGFEFRSSRQKLGLTLTASFIKVLLLPLLFVPAAVWFGFRDEALVAISVMLASPSTVACYIMARNMRNDAQLVSGIVMVTTLMSSVTITALVFVLRSLGLI
ncbi:MAG: AEC family transporter [Lachnospiraceae bacterium]|nr:AEC family transporter [Lachnospiraceae bacterium]